MTAQIDWIEELNSVYQYVGPAEIARRASGTGGRVVDSPTTLAGAIRDLGFDHREQCLIVTFVVDTAERLRLADRRSEHVACAGGEPVRAAGELTFSLDEGEFIVERATNQSTGYCPEPGSWTAVEIALDKIPIRRPDRFDPEFIFRKCVNCSQINIVKDVWYYCGVCEAPLPKHWNFV